MLWMVPFGYGLLLVAASGWWLVVGEPFDHGTYERIGAEPWPAIVGPLTSAQSAVLAAMVRLLGGNGGLLAGGLSRGRALHRRSRAQTITLSVTNRPATRGDSRLSDRG